MCVVYLAEYFIIHHKIDVLDEVEQKLDFTRSTQLSGQHIALSVQRFLAGDTELAPEIDAQIDRQDQLMNTLGNGGRIEGTEIILQPLSRLPRISFDNLTGYWNAYKETVAVILHTAKDTTLAMPPPGPAAVTADSLPVDTATPLIRTQNPVYERARLKQESLGLTLAYWYDVLFDDLENEVQAKKASVNTWVIAIILFDVALLILLFYAFERRVLARLRRLEASTAAHEQVFSLPQDEIGKLAMEINETLEYLKDATDFVIAIGEGNLSMNYKETLDSGYVEGKNKLADSLIDMQVKLKALNEEERKRQWANEGLARFVDILRSSNDNISVLGDKIIAALVKYTHSNQGALYTLNDDDPNNKHLEMISLFAFDIKKHEQQKVKLGQGILGQAFLERETTYLREIPAEYIRITSGLGDATPGAILMVPLKVDQEVYGIVELASFTAYEPHEISFVERLGETIASTLASVRAAHKNRALIEQFQQQTEEMRAQEEEMRQNMEELQATQEEIARKEKSYIARIQELEQGTSQNGDSAARLKAEFARAEQHYQQQLKDLQDQLAQRSHEGEWALAEEIERTLSLQRDALRITQDELDKRRSRDDAAG